MAVVVLVVAVDFVMKSQKPATPAAVSGIAASGKVRGDPKAPVSLLVFADFQCPYCQVFAVGAERQIEASYVKDGKVSITFKSYPVVDGSTIGESTWAAQAAECANLQGKFWDYHDKLYDVWVGEFAGTYTKLKLKQYAADLKLDTAAFNQCLDSDATRSAVQADTAEARRMGVQGTPTLFVNGRLLNLQSLDYSFFVKTFDALLK